MKVASVSGVLFGMLVFTSTSQVLGPQKAQAHHNALHSTGQVVATASEKAVCLKQAAGEVAFSSSNLLFLGLAATTIASIINFGLYNTRRQQSA